VNSQIWEQGKRKNLQVNTLRVFTELEGKTGRHPGKYWGIYRSMVFN